MALFKLLWLRKLVRRHTNPIAEVDAYKWKKRLSLFYMIAAWNAFGIVCYMIFSGKGDWAKSHGLSTASDLETPAQQWSKTLGIKEATVYRVTGGYRFQKYDVHNDFEQAEDKAVVDTETLSS